jgi:chromosome segregation ATPase
MFPVLDLNFMPIIKEGMLVTDERCAQYRVLEREIQILEEENLRLRRMEALEQEVFKYKKMAEREVDIIHRINQELVAKYKKETTELWKDIFSLHETTNQLQAQLYDLQNQNCEYEARFQQMSAAASFRILETKTSFLDGGTSALEV